jgi:hypothetical protein
VGHHPPIGLSIRIKILAVCAMLSRVGILRIAPQAESTRRLSKSEHGDFVSQVERTSRDSPILCCKKAKHM